MHFLRPNAQSNAATAAARAAAVAVEIEPALTREDLRDELEVFLHRLRHEVAEQVCQDLDARGRSQKGTEQQKLADFRNSISLTRQTAKSSASSSLISHPMVSTLSSTWSTAPSVGMGSKWSNAQSLGMGSKWSNASSLGSQGVPRRVLKTSIAKSLLQNSQNLEPYLNEKRTSKPDASILALDTGAEVHSNGTKGISRDKTFLGTEHEVMSTARTKGNKTMSKDIAKIAKQQTITSYRPGTPDKSTYTLLTQGGSLESDLTTVERPTTLRDNAKLIVTSNCFEQTVSVLVILNAASLGYDTQHWCEHRTAHANAIGVVSEKLFFIVFLAELLLRVFAFGTSFFTMDSRWWNVFDMMLVTFQTSEQVLKLLALWRPMDVHFLRLLRIARIMRVTRLVRAIHIFDELRVIASSVLNSASSLFWSLLLLWLLMYVFSLLFLEIILSAGETEHADSLEYWFGSLFRTFFTMFECIVGGVSWDEVAAPLMEDLGPFVGFLFGVYIAIAVFAMMNLITSVFVDKALRTVHDNKATETANRIRNEFVGSDNSKDLTWENFRDHLESPALRDYFHDISVELTEAQYLFELLDTDSSGSISADEIVEGCLRLRGKARSLDLALLAKDVYDLTVVVNETKLYVLELLQGLGFSTEP